jgi:hypothetical protein
LYRFLDAGSTETFRMHSRPASKNLYRNGLPERRRAAQERRPRPEGRRKRGPLLWRLRFDEPEHVGVEGVGIDVGEAVTAALVDLQQAPPATCRRKNDQIACVPLRVAGDDALVVPLTDDEREAIARPTAAAERGDFASDQEVRAAWAKCGL